MLRKNLHFNSTFLILVFCKNNDFTYYVDSFLNYVASGFLMSKVHAKKLYFLGACI